MKIGNFNQKINRQVLTAQPRLSSANTLNRVPKRLQYSNNGPLLNQKILVVQASTGDAKTAADDRRAGRATYRPSSYAELVGDAVQAVLIGLEDGLDRMEIEFPAVSNVDGKLFFDIFVVDFF